MKRLAAVIGVSLVVAASGALVSHDPFLYWSVLVGWAVLAALFAVVSRGWTRVICFNLAFALAALALFDWYLDHADDDDGREELSSTELTPAHDELGFAPEPGSTVRSAVHYFGEPEYDVTYTFDEHGLRAGPEALPEATECLLFFGGSFTFGEGSDDVDTWPSQVGLQSGGRYRVLNFAYSGYGPHHMLAAIETGLVERAVGDCEPTHAFYLAIPHHAVRAAGRTFFDTAGPRYVLDASGGAVREGNFDDAHPFRHFARQLESPFLALLAGDDLDYRSEDGVLFEAVVRTARSELLARYPNIEFRLIIWQAQYGEMNLDVLVSEDEGEPLRGVPIRTGRPRARPRATLHTVFLFISVRRTFCRIWDFGVCKNEF